MLGSSGVALVVTLMMMSVMVMMVVGLAGVMRNEQAAARNLTYQVLAEQLAEVGAQQGMTAVLTSTPAAGQVTATGPGWILAGNTTRYLVSPAISERQIKNLEEVGTNSLILGLRDGVRGGVYAGWTNLSLPGQPTNRPIGRYAWWVDDEGTKLNLNAVGSNNSNVFLPYLTKYLSGNTDSAAAPTFPFSADWVFVDPATGTTNATNAAQAQALRSRIYPLPTPESIKDTNLLPLTRDNQIGANVYRRLKGNVTTWSSNANLTPWGTPKVNLADPAVTTAQIKAMLTTNVWTNFSVGDLTLARKYGGGSATSTNAGNHGDLLLDQIVANLLAMRGTPVICSNYSPNAANNNANRHRNGLPMTLSSHYVGAYLEEVRVRLDGSIINNAGSPPTYRVDTQLGVMVKVVNPHPSASPTYSLSIQPKKFRFGITTARAPVASDIVSSNAGPPLNNFVGPISSFSTSWYVGPEWYNNIVQPWPLGARFTTNISVPARSRQALIFTQVITVVMTNVPTGIADGYVALDNVILSETVGGANVVRDWVGLDDFSMDGNGFFYGAANQDNGQMNFLSTTVPVQMAPVGSPLPTLTSNSFSATNALGLRKVDPKVRFPVSHWNTVGTNRGLLRSGGWPNSATGVRAWTTNWTQVFTNTGLSYLAADPVPAGLTDLTNHPHFVPGFFSTNGIKSVAQLGAIPTGIPWRTLRLQPTPATELAQGPPDWVLLDAFSVTNSTVVTPKVNLNGLITSLRSPDSPLVGVPNDLTGQPQARTWPLLGAMGALRTNLATTNTNASISNGIVLSLITNPSVALGSNGLIAVGASLSNALIRPNLTGSGWAASSGWPARRAALSNNFPPNGFALTGELLELRNVADDTTFGEDIIEGRLRGFLDVVTTRSDTFSVWSIGQGLVVVTNAAGNPVRTNMMGEVRKQTVFQRERNAAGAVTGLKILYTRNHVVE